MESRINEWNDGRQVQTGAKKGMTEMTAGWSNQVESLKRQDQRGKRKIKDKRLTQCNETNKKSKDAGEKRNQKDGEWEMILQKCKETNNKSKEKTVKKWRQQMSINT